MDGPESNESFRAIASRMRSRCETGTGGSPARAAHAHRGVDMAVCSTQQQPGLWYDWGTVWRGHRVEISGEKLAKSG